MAQFNSTENKNLTFHVKSYLHSNRKKNNFELLSEEQPASDLVIPLKICVHIFTALGGSIGGASTSSAIGRGFADGSCQRL